MDIDGIASIEAHNTGTSSIASEVVEALVSRGYSSSEAYKTVKDIEVKDGDTTEDVLKLALKKMAIF